MDSVKTPAPFFRPTSGTLEDWNEAFGRLEDYLRAHRIGNRLHQARIMHEIMERAARRHEKDPQMAPVTLAMQEVESLMREWFASVLPEMPATEGRLSVNGRLAMMLCDASRRWPYAFLNQEEKPGEMVADMRKSIVRAGPDLAVSSMVPRPMDLGPITEMAGETYEHIERSPLLRLILLLVLWAGLLAVMFVLTR